MTKAWRRVKVVPMCVYPLSLQGFQQGLGLLEVGGVKALGEPAVDLGQELMGIGALALLLPQASEARGGAQLPGFGLLATGNGEGLLEAGFRLGRIWDILAQQQLALEPICLGEQVTPPAVR